MKLASIAGIFLLLGSLAAAQTDDPTGPQPKLTTEAMTIIGDNGTSYRFDVELAATVQEQDTGLMFRPTVPSGTGMLFPWDPPQVSQMWMKNTIAPLDMVFIGADGTVKAIAENTVPYSLRDISSRVPVAATLELAAGTAAADGIDVGDKVIAKQFPGG